MGPDFSKKIQLPPDSSNFKTYMSNKPECTFSFRTITANELSNMIKKIKPKLSSGSDEISNKIIIEIAKIIPNVLVFFINRSLIEGIFPKQLKIGRITPLFKDGDTSQMNNYRPISLLKSISKLFEKAAHSQLENYFRLNNLFFENQYGFREGHNTLFANIRIFDLIQEAKAMNLFTDLVFIDLSKAFDTISHHILVSKLEYYGINNSNLNFFKSYLNERKTVTVVNGITSDITSLPPIGIPQGSILGPLLFLIYINDFGTVHENSILFADDTTLIFQDKDPRELEQKCNLGLSAVKLWFDSNYLTLNLKKQNTFASV